MNYQKKYNKYKTKYLNIKKILGGSEGPHTVPEGPPTVPEEVLFKPDQLSPLQIQEPHSLRISNMMHVSPQKFPTRGRSVSPTRGRSVSPTRDDYEAALRERSRSSSPDELRRTKSDIFSPLSLDDSPGPLEAIRFIDREIDLQDLGALELEEEDAKTKAAMEKQLKEEQAAKMKTRGQEAMEKQLKEEQAAKTKAAEELAARQKADDDDDSKLMEDLKKHEYYQYVLNYKSNGEPKYKYIDYHDGWRLRWKEKDKDNKSVRKSKNFPSLAKALKKLYELITDGIIILKEKD